MKNQEMSFLRTKLDVIVKDLQRANMDRKRDPERAWARIGHALDVALELVRQAEEGSHEKRTRDAV